MNFEIASLSPPGSYRWWYVDAISDDGQRALTTIFFLGSVFSPYYAKRLRRGERPLPEEHVAFNLALYDRGKRRTWIFSEYGRDAWKIAPSELSVVSNLVTRSPEGGLTIEVADRTVAKREDIRGRIRVSPEEKPLTETYVSLAPGHEWRAHIPRARVTVDFPSFRFEGTGYHDENRGDSPLHEAFNNWSWGRFHDPSGTRVFFDLETARERTLLTLDTRREPLRESLPFRNHRPYGKSWLVPWPTQFTSGRDEHGYLRPMNVERILDPSPFYARVLASSPSTRGAVPIRGMAEHISFERFAHPIVERMISFRLARPSLGAYGWIP